MLRPEARSGELPPATLASLWRQRLRWSIGWDQVSLQHMHNVRRSRSLHPCRKLSLFYILPARWLLLALSMFAVFGVPLLGLLQVTKAEATWVPFFHIESLAPFLPPQAEPSIA